MVLVEGDMRLKSPLVSVIMAVYNVARKDILDAAIESIVNQSMDDWELLICDDASTNQTSNWIQSWTERDSRIHLFRNEKNSKAAAARNRCIKEAMGEFIAVMDADDICSFDRLCKQAAFLSEHEEFMFVGLLGTYFCEQPGDMEKQYWFCERPRPEDFLMTLPFVHGSIMFRKNALTALNGYKATMGTLRSEDYDLLMRMYADGMRGANIRDATYYIREDKDSFKRRKYRYRFIEMYVKVKGFFALKLMPKGLLYAIKPLVVGAIPISLLNVLKKSYYQRKS